MAGYAQHVVQRGNNCQAIFLAEADYRYYLDCLAEAAVTYNRALHAYVLMTNHDHLLVTPNRTDDIARVVIGSDPIFPPIFNPSGYKARALYPYPYRKAA